MILDELRDLIGVGAALRFVHVFEGTDVQFPKAPHGPFFAELTRVLGPVDAERVRQRFAGSMVYIPRDARDERERRDREIEARLASGESPAAIARSYRIVSKLSARSVRRIAAAMAKRDVAA
jgi:hypothetical protein